MKQFLQEILALNEHHITPGGRKAILDRVRGSHFDNNLIWQEIRQQQGWYDAYVVLLILIIAFKDHLLHCEKEGVAHDPLPEFVGMREWIDRHWVVDSYTSIVAKLRDTLHDVEREKEVADFYRNGYNDQKVQIKDLKEQVAYWKARAEASTIDYRERNELNFSPEELAGIRALWAKAIRDEAFREEVIFNISQQPSTPEVARKVMEPLFKDKRANFHKITTKDVARWVLATKRYEETGVSESVIYKALLAVRPKK